MDFIKPSLKGFNYLQKYDRILDDDGFVVVCHNWFQSMIWHHSNQGGEGGNTTQNRGVKAVRVGEPNACRWGDGKKRVRDDCG